MPKTIWGKLYVVALGVHRLCSLLGVGILAFAFRGICIFLYESRIRTLLNVLCLYFVTLDRILLDVLWMYFVTPIRILLNVLWMYFVTPRRLPTCLSRAFWGESMLLESFSRTFSAGFTRFLTAVRFVLTAVIFVLDRVLNVLTSFLIIRDLYRVAASKFW